MSAKAMVASFRIPQFHLLVAVVSLCFFAWAIVHKGSEGPFGPYLKNATAHSAGSAVLKSAGTIEIIYFGSVTCKACNSWRRNHLPRWRQSHLSREVPLTLRSSNCQGATLYASLCKEVVRSEQQPVFVLLHRRSGKILAKGEGVRGFYAVGKSARRWWEQGRTAPTTLQATGQKGDDTSPLGSS